VSDTRPGGVAARKFGLSLLQVSHALTIARDVAGYIAEGRRRGGPRWGTIDLLIRRQPHLVGPGGRGRPKELARYILAGVEP